MNRPELSAVARPTPATGVAPLAPWKRPVLALTVLLGALASGCAVYADPGRLPSLRVRSLPPPIVVVEPPVVVRPAPVVVPRRHRGRGHYREEWVARPYGVGPRVIERQPYGW